MVNFVTIPQILKRHTAFCVWRLEKRSGQATKVPYDPRTGQMARTDDPTTFADFGTAMKAYVMGGYEGIGFRVSDDIGAIDLDHCIREDGTLTDVAASILGIFPSMYFERSPSGKGLRGFFLLSSDFAYDKTKYYIVNRKFGLEVYVPGATQRFVTVTGDVYRAGAVEQDDASLQRLLEIFMRRPAKAAQTLIEATSYLDDDQVITHALASANGEKFRLLYEGQWEEGYASQSDADMALVMMLAFWCGNAEEQIDRLFRASGLMREKWDRKTGDSTYGQITIRNAVAMNSNIYVPIMGIASAEEDFRHLSATLEEMHPHTTARYQRDEIGLGNIFADYYRAIARYNASRGVWYVYDGNVWRADRKELLVMELAKSLADKLYLFALQIKDEDVRTRYIKRMQKLHSRRHRQTMIDDARSVYPVDSEVFDSDRYLFNCKNGTLNLKTLEFRDHSPEDYITKICPITYDPEARSPRWEQYMDEVMCGRQQVVRYVQKALGYSLTGDTSLECLFILYGPTTRNGKTTFIKVLLHLMGEYGRNADPSVITAGLKNSGGPSEDVARLAGARFVGISEPERKITLNASLVKQLTGNNVLTARYLHENSFEFTPQAKIFIDTNHLPTIKDQTLFESKRIRIIPFDRHFTEEEQDGHLEEKLLDEASLSGILNWAVEGYRLYQREGLGSPEEVRSATAKYSDESDIYVQFTSAWLEPGDEYETSCVSAYRVFTSWCHELNVFPESYRNFRAAMEKLYRIVAKRPRGSPTTVSPISMITGARLRSEESSVSVL